MPIFHHRGRAVVYDRWGDGPPLVLLHNAGTQRHIWDDQVTVLRRSYEVFALDLPGYGESERPADGYRLTDYARLLEAFLAAGGHTDVVLIGNCLGAATSLRYAMTHPDNVRALVLINPLTWNTVSGGRCGPLAWADARLPLGPLADRLALPGPVVSRIINEQLGVRGRQRGLRHSPRLTAHWGDRGRLRALHGLVQDFPNYRELDTFTPTADFPPRCMIWGKQNRILSAAAGARLADTLRPQSSAVLSDCGHLPMVEDPERITGLITEFLGSAAVRPYREAGPLAR
ncbi:alpha/beta fold hydrolase [Nocardia arthritidis]|uniref:alpha/beta fold hydrolase n=1 Tax=Nocardia arthritidis TaxID=228602 RepID=UPI00142E67FC|nr:alpha/beta hydrolase [Nocardia arthritidis]